MPLAIERLAAVGIEISKASRDPWRRAAPSAPPSASHCIEPPPSHRLVVPTKNLCLRRNDFPVSDTLRASMLIPLYRSTGATDRYHLPGCPHCPTGSAVRMSSCERPLYELRREELCPRCTTEKGYGWFMAKARRPTAPHLHQLFAYALDVHDLIAKVRRAHSAAVKSPEDTKDRYWRMLEKIDRFEATRTSRIRADLLDLTEHAAFVRVAERFRALNDPARASLFFAEAEAHIRGTSTFKPATGLPLDETLILFAGQAAIEVSLRADLPHEILIATRLETAPRGRQWAYCMPRYVLDYLLPCLFSLHGYFTAVAVPDRAVAEVAAALFSLEDLEAPEADLTQLVAAATAVCETSQSQVDD